MNSSSLLSGHPSTSLPTRRDTRSSPGRSRLVRMCSTMNTDSSPERGHRLVRRQVRRLDRRVGPSAEVGPVGLVDPQQLGDHRQREGRGQLGHEVDLTRGRRRRPAARGRLADGRLQPGRARGVKRRLTRLRKAACSGGSMCRIEGAPSGRRSPQRVVDEGAPPGAEMGRIAAQVPDVLVPADHPEPRGAHVDGDPRPAAGPAPRSSRPGRRSCVPRVDRRIDLFRWSQATGRAYCAPRSDVFAESRRRHACTPGTVRRTRRSPPGLRARTPQRSRRVPDPQRPVPRARHVDARRTGL